MQLDDKEEVFARLTVLEFAIEIIFATQMASVPPETAATFRRDFSDKMRNAYGPMTGDADIANYWQEIMGRAGEIADRLMEKAARREAEIRAVPYRSPYV